jgi:hypothetical protein
MGEINYTKHGREPRHTPEPWNFGGLDYCQGAGDCMKGQTPDGLNLYHLDFVGQVVLAHEHNKKVSELEQRSDELLALIAECDEYLNINNLTSIGHGSILHRKMKEAKAKAQEN